VPGSNYREAIRIKPAYAEVYCNLGLAMAREGKIDEAVASFREALRLKSGFSTAHQYLELARGKK
jgi:Tfp pilus assembly protein PilF